MGESGESNGSAVLRIGWGDKSVSIRGAASILFFMWLTLVGAGLYSNWRLEQTLLIGMARAEGEHVRMTQANEQTACMVSMSQGDREKFRVEFRPGAWSRWCPWIKE